MSTHVGLETVLPACNGRRISLMAKYRGFPRVRGAQGSAKDRCFPPWQLGSGAAPGAAWLWGSGLGPGGCQRGKVLSGTRLPASAGEKASGQTAGNLWGGRRDGTMSPMLQGPCTLEMWSQTKQVTATQEGQHVFYSSPKYNLKAPNESRFC